MHARGVSSSGGPPLVREQDIIAFAKRHSDFTGKKFDEELPRWTVFCKLSNLVFGGNGGRGTGSNLRIPLLPEATNSDSVRTKKQWSRLEKILHRLGIPVSKLFPREKIEAGQPLAVRTGLVFFYFMYNLSRSHDFAVEFAFEYPPELIDFLQSFDSVRALVLSGAIPLSAVPTHLHAEFEADIQGFKRSGSVQGIEESRGASRSSSTQPQQVPYYSVQTEDHQEETVTTTDGLYQHPNHEGGLFAHTAAGGGFASPPSSATRHPHVCQAEGRESVQPGMSPDAIAPSSMHTGTTVPRPQHTTNPSTTTVVPGPSTSAIMSPERDQFLRHEREAAERVTSNFSMDDDDDDLPQHDDHIQEGEESIGVPNPAPLEEDLEESDGAIADALIEENENLREQLHQVLQKFNQVDAEAVRLKELDRENKKAQAAFDASLTSLKSEHQERETNYKREVASLQQNLSAKQADLHRLQQSFDEVSQELSECHPKIQSLEDELQLLRNSSSSPLRTTAIGGLMDPNNVSSVSTMSSAQKVLAAEQENKISELQEQVRYLTLELDRYNSQGTAQQPAERNLFPSTARSSANDKESVSPAPHPPSPPQQQAQTNSVSSSSVRTQRRSPSQRVAIPSTEIFVKDPSTLPRNPQRLQSVTRSNSTTAGDGNLDFGKKTIRLEDLEDSPQEGQQSMMIQNNNTSADGADMIKVNCHDLAAEMHQKLLELSVSRSVASDVKSQSLVEGIRKSLWLMLSSTHVLESRIMTASESIQTLQHELDQEEDQKLHLVTELDEVKNQLIALGSKQKHQSNKADIKVDVLQGRISDLEAELKRSTNEVQLQRKKHQDALESVAKEEERQMEEEKRKRRDLQKRHSASIERDRLWRELCGTLTKINEVTLQIAAAETDEEAMPLAQRRAELESVTGNLTRQIGESFEREQRLIKGLSSQTTGGTMIDEDATESDHGTSKNSADFNNDVSTALKQMMREAVAQKDELQKRNSDLKEKYDTQYRELRSTVGMLEVERKTRKQLEEDLRTLLQEKKSLSASKASSEIDFRRQLEGMTAQLRAAQNEAQETKQVWGVPPPSAPAHQNSTTTTRFSSSSPPSGTSFVDSPLPKVSIAGSAPTEKSWLTARDYLHESAKKLHTKGSTSASGSLSPFRKSLLEPRMRLNFNF